jgi:hypothetical protein
MRFGCVGCAIHLQSWQYIHPRGSHLIDVISDQLGTGTEILAECANLVFAQLGVVLLLLLSFLVDSTAAACLEVIKEGVSLVVDVDVASAFVFPSPSEPGSLTEVAGQSNVPSSSSSSSG